MPGTPPIDARIDAPIDAPIDASVDARIDASPACFNNMLDIGELDVDCGGAMCPACRSVFAPDSATLAIFEFDGNVLDSSGNGRHATLLGGSYEATAWGQGLRLLTDPQGFTWPFAGLLSHPYTIEMVLTPEQVGCYGKLFGFADGDDNGWYYCDGFVDHPSTTILMSTALAAGTRHYVAFVSTSATSVDVYFQGTRLGGTPTSFTAPPSGAIFFRDDSSGGGPRSEQVGGPIEALRLSNTTRTAQQIADVQTRLAAQP